MSAAIRNLPIFISEFAKSLDHLFSRRLVVVQPFLTKQVPCFNHEVLGWARSVSVLEYIAWVQPVDVLEEPVAKLVEKRCRQVRPAKLVSRHCMSTR
ncbi:hypothetical protein A5759_04570 [Mycobacterium sp. 852014-52144_SCH5372336]|nr:hypothetical protein A5759_04570 [Mycobacterium sp. 852014-52144_SCH5372336]